MLCQLSYGGMFVISALACARCNEN